MSSFGQQLIALRLQIDALIPRIEKPQKYLITQEFIRLLLVQYFTTRFIQTEESPHAIEFTQSELLKKLNMYIVQHGFLPITHTEEAWKWFIHVFLKMKTEKAVLILIEIIPLDTVCSSQWNFSRTR